MSKKSNSTTLLIVGGGFAAWYLLTRIGTIGGLKFIPRGLAVVGGAVSLLLGVQNPSSTGLYIESFIGSLMLNGNAIGDVSNFQQTYIAPNAETPVSVLVSPNFFGIAQGAINELSGNEGGGTGMSATLTGQVNINNSSLPISVNFLS